PALPLYLNTAGLREIELHFSAKVSVIKDVANLQFAIPACPVTAVDLVLPNREPVFSVVPSTRVEVEKEGDHTRVRAHLKYTQSLFARWRDRLLTPTRVVRHEEPTVFDVVEDVH